MRSLPGDFSQDLPEYPPEDEARMLQVCVVEDKIRRGLPITPAERKLHRECIRDGLSSVIRPDPKPIEGIRQDRQSKQPPDYISPVFTAVAKLQPTPRFSSLHACLGALKASQ